MAPSSKRPNSSPTPENGKKTKGTNPPPPSDLDSDDDIADQETTVPKYARPSDIGNDGFTTVEKKKSKKRPSLKPRPHPADLARSSIALGPKPGTITLLVRPTNEFESLHKVPSLQLAAALQVLQPEPVALRRIRGGGLALDFPQDASTETNMAVTTLAGLQVAVSLPRPRVGSYGTIVGQFSEAAELRELFNIHENNPELLDIKRIGSTNKWILHFAASALPATVTVFYNCHRVAPFFRHPIQCFKCRRFNHTAELCRGSQCCNNCGKKGHLHAACTSNTPRCVNCGKGHQANSKQCPHRIFELRVQKTLASTVCTEPEARKLIATKPAPAKHGQRLSYAAAAAAAATGASQAHPAKPAPATTEARPKKKTTASTQTDMNSNDQPAAASTISTPPLPSLDSFDHFPKDNMTPELSTALREIMWTIFKHKDQGPQLFTRLYCIIEDVLSPSLDDDIDE